MQGGGSKSLISHSRVRGFRLQNEKIFINLPLPFYTTFTLRAETAVKIGIITRQKFPSLIAQEPTLYDAVWHIFAARTCNLYMHARPERTPTDNEFLFVITGAVAKDSQRTKAPALNPIQNGEVFQGATSESLVMLLLKVSVPEPS